MRRLTTEGRNAFAPKGGVPAELRFPAPPFLCVKRKAYGLKLKRKFVRADFGSKRDAYPSAKKARGVRDLAGVFASGTRRNQPPVIVLMTEMIGRNIATTIVPTTTARKTISSGSMTEVSAPTALSTSSS